VKSPLLVLAALGLTACTSTRVQADGAPSENPPKNLATIVPPGDQKGGGGEGARLAFIAAAKAQGFSPLAQEISIHERRGWSAQALSTLYRLRMERLGWHNQIGIWLQKITPSATQIAMKRPDKNLEKALQAWLNIVSFQDPASELRQNAAKLDVRLIPWAKAITASDDPKVVAVLQHSLHRRSGQAIVEALGIAQVAEDEDRIERLKKINAAIIRRNRARALAEEYIRQLDARNNVGR
jgi:hypothetical protein